MQISVEHHAMYEDAQEHGIDKIISGVLEFVENKAQLLEREHYWVERLQARSVGYNQQTAGDNRHWG